MLTYLFDHWQLLLTLFVIQGCFGVLLFEWGWKQVERVRPDSSEEAFAEQYPSFRRPDAHLWKRLNFYPGCFIMLVPRAIWIFFWFFSVGLLNYICYAGQDMEKPVTGWRRTLHKWGTWIMCPLILIGFGYRVIENAYDESDVEYSKYLGPNWRKNKFQGKQVSTIVSNHIGFFEILLWMSLLTPPAFTPAHFIKKFPIGDHYCRAL